MHNSKRKTIGIFSYDFFPSLGGQGRHLYEISKRIPDNSKFNVLIFSPAANKIINHINIFKKTQSYHFGNIIFSILLNFKIKYLISKYNIDLIHLHGGPGGILLFRKINIPVIYTAHHTYYQQHKYIKKEFWKIIFRPFEIIGYRRSNNIICVSNSTKKVLANIYKIDPSKISVIPNGIDRNKFFNKKYYKVNNSIFFVGRLDKRKGIDFLIKTLPKIKSKIINIKLYIAGSGKYYPKLKNFVQNNDLNENVIFLGKISDNELLNWYNKVQIVIIPSVFEGFGITAVEAMACGAPIIATNTDGLSDLIKNNSNGLLVNYNDIDDLSNKIILLLDNENIRRNFSEKGIEMSKLYQWDRIANDTLKLYEKTID